MPSFVKELLMKEFEKQFESSNCAFISTFQGLSVADISEFRRSIEKISGRSIVIKHAMAKKVFAKRSISEAEKLLKSQVLVTFGSQEPQKISKAIVEFAKTHDKFIPSGVVMDNHVYDKEFVRRLAQLPSRHELLTQVAVRVKSPISGFVITLGQVVRGFVIALNEIRKQKEGMPQTA